LSDLPFLPIFIASCGFGGVFTIRSMIRRVGSSRSGFLAAMTKTFPPKVSATVRDAILKSPGATLCGHLGYLHMWYGIAEVHITTIMAFALGFRNLEKLEYVVRGMDGRVKCERLRQAAKNYMPLGSEIEVRLRFFEKKVVPLRNKLSHCWPYLDEPSGRVSFVSAGSPMPDSPEHSQAESIHLDELFAYAVWLNLFAQDLQEALTSAVAGGPLEVANPRSDRPTESQTGPPPKVHRATSDKRARKLRRKPQS